MARPFQMNGIEALQAKLKKNIQLNDVRQVVRAHGAEMNKAAQLKAPVDTGFLQGSIVFTLADTGLTAQSTATANYSIYVEFGTRYQSAQPFMRPAFNAQKRRFKADLERLMH